MQIIYELIAIMFEGGFSVEQIKNHILEIDLECDNECIELYLQDYINNLQEDTQWMILKQSRISKKQIAHSPS